MALLLTQFGQLEIIAKCKLYLPLEKMWLGPLCSRETLRP